MVLIILTACNRAVFLYPEGGGFSARSAEIKQFSSSLPFFIMYKCRGKCRDGAFIQIDL